MRLRPGLRAIGLADDVVQLGLDARWAVRVTGLTGAERDVLLTIRPGGRVADHAPSGVDDGRWVELLASLRAAGVLLGTNADRPAPTAGAADVEAWSLVDAAGDGRGRVEHRGHARVGVIGLGPTGLGLAVALAASGVGSLVLDDPGPVRSVDIGPGGYRWSDVGSTRQAVAARLVRDVAPSLAAPDRTRDPDVLVIVEQDVVEPVRATTVAAAGVVHLSLIVHEADVLVGPLVVPGHGPCLRCLDLHRADVDPTWPTLVARLSVDRDHLHPARAEVPVLAGVAAHLAAAAVLGHLDGRPGRPGLTWTVGLPDAVPRARTWQPHAQCGCTGPPPALTGVRTPARGGPDQT